MLQTLTIIQALNYADNLRPTVDNFFAAVSYDCFDVASAEEDLLKYYSIMKQIRKVEERTGITDLLYNLSIVEDLYRYYDPANKIRYYKEGKDVKEKAYAISRYIQYMEESDELMAKIECKRENNTVELDI